MLICGAKPLKSKLRVFSANLAASGICFLDRHHNMALADDIIVVKRPENAVENGRCIYTLHHLLTFMSPCLIILIADGFCLLNGHLSSFFYRTLPPIMQDPSPGTGSVQDTMNNLPDIYLSPTVPTSPATFEGADNLGGILWSIALYYGIFQPLFQRESVFFSQPSEWLLYPLAKGLQQEEEDWFLDFKEGLQYQAPPIVDFTRAFFFLAMGFLTNRAIVNSLGGDLFWGWSTGACLALPAALLSYSRIRRPTRESVDKENMVKKNFEQFAEKRLKRTSGKVAAEASIVLSFRRSFLEYRSKDDISDRDLRKIVRSWVGYKTNMEGDYVGVELINVRKEAAEQIRLKNRILESQKSVQKLIGNKNDKSTSNIVGEEDCNDDDLECLTEGKDFIRM